MQALEKKYCIHYLNLFEFNIGNYEKIFNMRKKKVRKRIEVVMDGQNAYKMTLKTICMLSSKISCKYLFRENL